LVRVQIRLSEEQHARARRKAAEMGISLSELILRGLDLMLSGEPGVITGKRFAFIGSGSSGKSDISVRHDDYLADDFK
jgi:hypothetical protein